MFPNKQALTKPSLDWVKGDSQRGWDGDAGWIGEGQTGGEGSGIGGSCSECRTGLILGRKAAVEADDGESM